MCVTWPTLKAESKAGTADAAAAVILNEGGHQVVVETDGGIQLAATSPRHGGGQPEAGSQPTVLMLLHPVYLLGYTLTLATTSRLTDTLSCTQTTFIVLTVFLLRSAGCVTLASLPFALRPAVTYLAGMVGVLLAKFTEASLIQPDVIAINSLNSLANDTQLPLMGSGSHGSGSRRTSAVDHESRLMAARRRRTSSAALTSTQASAAAVSAAQSGANQGNASGNSKVRRTSLPALLANKKDQLLVSVSLFSVFFLLKIGQIFICFSNNWCL